MIRELRFQLALVLGTVAIFLTMNTINEWLFLRLEFTKGINWVFLPAGARLLCTLLFGTAGAIGLLLSGLILNFYHFAFEDPMRALMGAVAGSLAPYLVYLYARQQYGLQASLRNLTARRLLVLIVMCAAASPLLHHVWFAFEGASDDLLESYIAMFIGDLNGILLVVYSIKGLLTLHAARSTA